MEVLGVISEVTEAASKASDLLCYISSVRDAPDDIRGAKDEIASHLTLLRSVQSLVQSDGQNTTYFASLAETNGPLQEAYKAISELVSLVGGDLSDQDPNPRERIRTLVSRIRSLVLDDMAWPLKQNKIREIRRRLEVHKASINMALIDALFGICAERNPTSANVNKLYTLVKETNEKLSGIEKVRIIDHCLPPNRDIPNIHRDRRAQQEPKTCEWVSREKDFRSWLNEPHNPPGTPRTGPRFICIHGIPGAGKTVLASSIAETTAIKCKAHGYAYYYCLYSRKQDETVPFLRWVLRQLCKQKQNMVLPEFEEAYEREEALSVDDLLNCLEKVSLIYENGVHIIVDAVDESNPRENIITVLSRIGTEERFGKVSLLVTSREESDIMEPIRQLRTSCACISMSNKNVQNDLRRYVHEQLTKMPVFARWEGDSFLEEVEYTLTQKANGMFRWAVCQLDVLKRMRNSSDIRSALEKLPRDIFETYERILMDIPVNEREFAKTALALICSDTAEIPTAEVLVSACLYGVPFGDIGQFTVYSLTESCGSLVSLSELNRAPFTCTNRDHEKHQKFHRCSLAHYTVKEYLFSPDVARGKAGCFALSDEIVGNIDLKVIFTGLSQFGHQIGGRRNMMNRYEEYCLRMTEKSLSYRRADIIHNQEVREMVLKSLTPTSPHFPSLDVRGMRNGIIRGQFATWFRLWNWESRPAHPPTGLLVNLAILNWRDLSGKYLESLAFQNLPRKDKAKTWTEDFQLGDRKRETLLGYCLRERQLNSLRMFVNYGASFEHEHEALYTAMSAFQGRNRAYETLEFLLRSGADPNPMPGASIGGVRREKGQGFALTPLQLAVYMLEYEWVELLLEEGADVNMIGTPDGVIPSSFDHPDPQSDQTKAMQEIIQRTALEICSQAQPAWIDEPGTNATSVRKNIRKLLERHGAEDPVRDENMELNMEVDSDNNEDIPEIVDLSML
ncbi:hypothetical protein E0Z10_g8423 [Xylaria hypoxylon]|uniref:Nephrocystin 3-like N-terminal domain-containing protein n=1 Tax=Xylaria hypoxylon TaxID=37992 RepID=A0A4Z0YP32_9PEZI|nr:hypothetical protein E0Z10_g8423 [Xylaria hypoxylon]